MTQPGGEKALMEQIQTLQAQLDDCLDNKPMPAASAGGEIKDWRSVKYWRAYHKACDTIRGSLGLDDGSDHTGEWRDFRDQLITNKALNEFWRDQNFTWGFFLVCRLVDDLIILNYNYGHDRPGDNYEERMNEERKNEIPKGFVSSCAMGDETDHQAVLRLLDALKIMMELKPEEEWDMCPEDVYDILNDLETITRCQQMVLTVAKEEKQKSQ